MARSDARKHAYHHGDLPRALVEAASEILAESGAAQLSLRAVARRAGVSHAAPAHHFGDKAGLLTAVATEGFCRFRQALEAACAQAGDEPLARLAAAGRAYVHFAVDARPFFELMFRPAQLVADAPELVEAADAAYQVLLDAVQRVQAAGVAPDLDPRDMALAAWAKVHGLATLWLDGNLAARFGLDLDETLDRVLMASIVRGP